MRGSKVIVFVIEANKSSRSDENYIRALMNSLYSKEFQIKFIFILNNIIFLYRNFLQC